MADHGHGKGHATRDEGLHIAIDRAWEDAKSKQAKPGFYKAEITVECHNPIRTYIVTLDEIDGET